MVRARHPSLLAAVALGALAAGGEAHADPTPEPATPSDAAPATTPGEPAEPDAAEPGPPEPEAHYYIVPSFAYDTDDGFAFGARAELAFSEPGYEPYKSSFVLHSMVSVRGYQHHRFRYERVGFGPGKRLRFTLHVAYRQWLNDGYWGLGNTTTRDAEYDTGLLTGDPDVKRYRYSLYQPFVHATLRARLDGPWQAFGALDAKYSVVGTYPGSLLEEQEPFGIDGGLGLILTGGVLYDSREPEVNPTSGVLAELSGRVSAPGGAGFFGGLFASVRGFVSPWKGVTFAGRLMGEYLWGEVPFYEMAHWGGLTPVTGFGGFETLRGVAFGRWHSPGKLIANAELRLEVLRHHIFERSMAWQLAFFGDLGATAGIADNTVGSGGLPIHPGGGAGVRVIFDKLFVARVDVAVGVDPVRQRDGTIDDATTLGFYIVFDQAF